jgi:anti-sigma regulatory factor (Ser/Thr protein kinase)
MAVSNPSQTFAGRADTIRDARAFVRGELGDTHVDVESAVLLTSELASNAVVHAGGEYMVTIRRNPGSIRVELVNDAPETLPVLREASEGGRGLRLVEAVASRWGTESDAAHKLVWFELPDPE